MDELLELCLKRIEDLEKKLEKYYDNVITENDKKIKKLKSTA